LKFFGFFFNTPAQPKSIRASHGEGRRGGASMRPSPLSSAAAPLVASLYPDRLTVERNWQRGRYSVCTLWRHTDGVMCLQFSETLQLPSFPILITCSCDRTVRV
jgi:F-box/WD-40 domain protein MET30